MQRVDVHVGRRARGCRRRAGTSTWRDRPWPSSTSTVTTSPGATPRTLASISDSTRPPGGRRIGAAVAIDDALEARSRRHAGDGEVPLAVAGAQAHGHGALRLDGHDAGQTRERVPRRSRPRLDEGHRHVLPLGLPELRLDQSIDRVDEDEADDQHRHGERDAERPRPRRAAAAARGCAAPCVPAVPRYRETSGVSSSVRRYRAGASGRIASAGGIAHGAPHRAEGAGAATTRLSSPQRRRRRSAARGSAGRESGRTVVEADDQRAEQRAGRDADDAPAGAIASAHLM